MANPISEPPYQGVAGKDVFIGRQPIVDRDEHVVAYELLFRDSASASSAQFEDAHMASIRVMVNTFASMGVDEVLGTNRGFINATSEVIFSELVKALPADRVVIELLEDIPVTPKLVERCGMLKAAGFRLALDDWVVGDPREALLDRVHMVKVDLRAVPAAGLPRLVRKLRRHSLGLLAEKVETREEFERCRDLDFDLFQGYFFARPESLTAPAIDPAKTALIKVMQQIQAEAETADIAETLKQHVNLSVTMLRLVNSAAMGRPHKVGRIEDAMSFLGRRQLGRWISLLLFAADGDSLESPLLQTAAHRGRLMEILSSQIHDGEPRENDRAFLVGMFSLVDVLLRRPLKVILPELHLDEVVQAAILEKEGPLGALLMLALHLESTDFDRVDELLAELGIAYPDLQEADNQAYGWIHKLIAAPV